MKSRRKLTSLICFLILSLSLSNCTTVKVSRELVEVENAKSINKQRKYIKVHMKEGDLYVLNSWFVDVGKRQILGLGNHLDINRRNIESRVSRTDDPSAPPVKPEKFILGYDDIILIETNDKGTNPGAPAMIVAGIATGAFAIYCAINPKACFGSCPTYFVDRGDSLKLVGEGFSSSISKTLEAVDVDRIDDPVETSGGLFFLTVKNEALETHMIKKVNMLLVEKEPGTRVLNEEGKGFYQINNFQAPEKAIYNHASILDMVKDQDDLEWFSLADSSDLSKKEEIHLQYNNPGLETGLVIRKRQSLMTTFLFYHSLSLLGKASAYYYSQMEGSSDWIRKRSLKMYDLLGGIEVWYEGENGRWEKVTEISEQGPIAECTNLVLLPKTARKKINIKIRMTRGLWRINYLGLASVLKHVEPISIKPSKLWKEDIESVTALEHLLTEHDYLVTYPKDVYRLQYNIPPDREFEYFIESEGYYVEWMREEWLPSQDLKAARAIFRSPHHYLKSMAPAYKLQEPEMEKVFWNSRYTKN